MKENALCQGGRKDIKVRKRIYIIDEIRGLAILAMVFYHFLFSAGEVFSYNTAYKMFHFFMPVEPIFAMTFVFISGICTKLSRSNLRRGLILFMVALAINLVTAIFIPALVIRFGILNLLSICMILYGLLEKFFKKINPKAGFICSFIIFMLTWSVKFKYIGIFEIKLFMLPDFLFNSDFLFPLGLKNSEFYSIDYFPIFPWLFLFLSGSFFSGLLKDKNLPQTFYHVHSKLLCTIGRYSLVIYILHQPIIFGLLYILNYK